jgi:hypothetical protein
MEPSVKKMEAQLQRWNLKIAHLAAKTQVAGVQAGFDALIYVDELKALHAIAQAKLDAFKASEDTRRTRLKAEMQSAWADLDAAFKKPMP